MYGSSKTENYSPDRATSRVVVEIDWRKTRQSVRQSAFHHADYEGRKTGRERTTPVLYLQHGADLIVVASFGGNDMHPAWYLNLERCPEAEVIINGERRRFSRIGSLPKRKDLSGRD